MQEETLDTSGIDETEAVQFEEQAVRIIIFCDVVNIVITIRTIPGRRRS